MVVEPVSLQQLLKKLDASLPATDVMVRGLALDSRKVTAGDLFLAYPGHQADGRAYIGDAVRQGACAIAYEPDGATDAVDGQAGDIPAIAIPDLAAKASRIAARFYGHPTRKLAMCGITGTNGKTSCCCLLAGALQHISGRAVMMSTVGNGIPGQLEASVNTTPDAISVQAIAAAGVASGARYGVMEVSSHGLVQDRVESVRFHTAIFTNLSHEHLDYHGDMSRYGAAKRRLMLANKLQYAIINADDAYGRELLADDAIKARKFAYSLKTPPAGSDLDNWIWAEDVRYTLRGIQAKLYTPWGQARLVSPLLGHFNLANLLAVAAALGALFGDIQKWIVGLNAVKAVPGRMQQLGGGEQPLVVVDYAHSPDALEQALKALRQHSVGNIWCVFGCGGDRDAAKRPIMGRIAEKLANRLILTDDNPRHESAEGIAGDIRAGLRKPDAAPYIASRRDAIARAISKATADDLILVAGKGHEDYQEIDGERRHYSDVETVLELLGGPR